MAQKVFRTDGTIQLLAEVAHRFEKPKLLCVPANATAHDSLGRRANPHHLREYGLDTFSADVCILEEKEVCEIAHAPQIAVRRLVDRPGSFIRFRVARAYEFCPREKWLSPLLQDCEHNRGVEIPDGFDPKCSR